MAMYHWMYRFGATPWERYRETGLAALRAFLDAEEEHRPDPPGRALDLGCGRGRYTVELARRGWEAVGLDYVPAAIDAAHRSDTNSIRYVVGDVTKPPDNIGTFDLFLDVGCISGLDAASRHVAAGAVTLMANAGAALLLMAFGPNPWPWIHGVSQSELRSSFAGWDLVTVVAAETTGIGWPMNTTAPCWYHFRLQA